MSSTCGRWGRDEWKPLLRLVPLPRSIFDRAEVRVGSRSPSASVCSPSPAGNIKTKAILGAAGSILAIEARHAGWIRDINGVLGAPVAFEKGKTKAQILTAVGKTGFIVG